MRVLRVSHSAAVEEWRGRERALESLGVEVELLSARRSHEGAGVVRLEPRPGERVTGVGTVGRHPALFLYDPRPIWRALATPVDVIDVHEEPFALATAEVLLLRALRGRRAPVVLYTAQNLHKRYPVPFRWLERWALRSASGISACNSEAAAIAEAKGFAGRARVIPLGIDPERFRAREPGEGDTGTVGDDTGRLGDDTGTVVVGLLGRLVTEKGVDVLLRAVQGEPALRARIAGTGPLAEVIPARARELGIADRIELVGAVSPDAVVDFYRSLDVMAIPSLSTSGWTEQFGRVAIEAMACGVPVVASDAGALPDVVADAGIVVPEGDAAALGSALVAASGERARALREAGFARAAECTWDAVGRDYLDLYRSVLHTGATARREDPGAVRAAPGAASVSPSDADRPLEVIVVAYGSPALLRTALEPVRALATTVVDNSSLPEIAALCDELGVRYIDAGVNRGFGTGVNIGLGARRDPRADVLLLNPDARIDPAEIAKLQRRLRAEPDLASVAPAQVDDAGSPARVEWPFPSPANAWLEAVGLGRLQHGGRYVIGSVLLLRAEAIDQVGGFDERYFLYAEETDWAYRAHLLCWRHAEVTDAAATHTGAGTSTDSRRREAHFHASQERYFRKHFGPLGWLAARAAVWTGSMARALVLPGARGKAARARAALYRLGPVRVEARLGRAGTPAGAEGGRAAADTAGD